MSEKRLFLLVSSLFVLSGVAGLIYQITWFKQLSYFIGNTTTAQSILLATFMAGLAIGAWYWGKKSDSVKSALKTFAWLEILIAIYCFLYMPIFSLFESLFINFVTSMELESDSSTVFIARLVVSAIVILPPTILMGGTLPLLVRHLSRRFNEIGKNIAVLYFINSLGAVIGGLLAGFYLLQNLGVSGTTYAGAIMDLIVGVACLALVKTSSLFDGKKEEEVSTKDELQKVNNSQYKIVVIVAAVSGLSAMAYEIIWLRLLIPVLSSSTYSFTIIIAAFISGITLGSFLVYKYSSKIKHHYQFLGYCQLAIVISILLTITLYERLPYTIWSAIGEPAVADISYGYYVFIQFMYVFLLLLIPTIFMGMTLPIASKLSVTKMEERGSAVGKIFSVNTIGTVIGALLTGLVLIPTLGIKTTLQLILALNLVLAFMVFRTESLSLKRKITLGSITLVSIIYFTINVTTEKWMYSIMISEIPRQINRVSPPGSYEEFQENMMSLDKVHFYREGPNGTFVVAEHNNEVYLFTNGKGDASSVADVRTQVSLGLTPLILHKQPDSVFVIGFGAGTTIGHVLTHSRVKYAEVAEISSEVIEASKYFDFINEQPLKQKNLNVIKDDGISALRLSHKKFDVIISQPSNPWSAGVGSLFTKEFFRTCKDKLRPGGYVAQWFNLYEMDDKSLRLILRTAYSEFKNVGLWQIGTNDILLLCSNDHNKLDINAIAENYKISEKQLSKIGMHDYTAFLSQELTNSQETIRNYAGSGPLNTEDLPLLEHWAPKAYFYNSRPENFYPLDQRTKFSQNDGLMLHKYYEENNGFTDNEILQTALFQSLGGNKEFAFYLANMNPEVYRVWAEKAKQLGNMAKAEEYLSLADGVIVSKDSTKTDYEKNADKLAREGKYKEAIIEINKAITENPTNAVLHYQKGTFYLSLKDLNNAAIWLKSAIGHDKTMIEAYNNLAIVWGQQKKYADVIKLLNTAETISTKNAKVYFNRGYAFALSNNMNNAIRDFTKAITLDPNYGQAYLMRGNAYLAVGNQSKACADFSLAQSKNVQGAAQMVAQVCNK